MQTNMPISLFTEAQNIHNKQALTIEAAIDIYRYSLVEGLINGSLYISKFWTREKRRQPNYHSQNSKGWKTAKRKVKVND